MKRLKKNILFGFSKQIFAILYGFVLPRLILIKYGSETNGLISSITQFLQLISYLDLGVDAVVQSALYLPLVQGNTRKISEIMTSARKFFRTLARIVLVYVICLVVVYPNVVKSEFDYWYVAIIIMALSINSFSQYYFGIVNATLLKADQRGYIYDCLSIVAYIANTIIGILIIKAGGSIQVLEFCTSIVYLIRPIYMAIYVKNHYKINYNVKYEGEPIPQKWNGIAQHISAIVIDNTDVVILTLFSSLQSVSVYSVYNLVVMGVRSLVLSMTQGIAAHFGKIIAEGNQQYLYRAFRKMEWSINTISVIVFGCTSVLIVPFVKIYTHGVNDVDYIVPLFAALITLAQMLRSIRLPYNVVILSAGHYKQTQRNYIVATILNIVISVALVFRYGLVGVAVGTLVAFLYQDVWMAYYVSNNIVCWPFANFIKQNAVDFIIAVVAIIFSRLVKLGIENIWDWIIYSVVITIIWICVSLSINYFVYKDMVLEYLNYFLRKSAN